LLSGAAKSIGRGDLSARVPSGRCDELGQLGETFDLVGSESSTRLKTDDEKTFVCTYEVASLPLETKMHISPEFMDSKILNSRWISDLTEDGFVALPSGMSRILAGEGYVTLTRQTATIERNFTLGRTRQWERPPIY
jgi:hypothetical protein